MTVTHVSPRFAYPDTGAFPRSRSPIHPRPDARALEGAERLAGFLGWFSIGLGITSLLAPRAVARFIGARGDRTDQSIFQVIGVQELAVGVGILATKRPAGWLWARVAGDVAHLTMLSGAMASGPPEPGRMAAATAGIAGITALDAVNAFQLTRRPDPSAQVGPGGVREVHRTITIGRPAEELYRYWREFRNLPRIMSHLESVETTDDRHSHWKAKAPAGMTVEWDAEVTEDRPNESIAWRSTGGDVDNGGSVRFVPAPGGRGTELHVKMRFDPPGGTLGHWFAWLFGESPEQQVYDSLRHFKQVIETGEVVLSDSSGNGTKIVQRPGQPPESAPGR